MRTRCGIILAAYAVATCAVGAEHCRPTGELQEKAQALADLAVKEGLQGALQFCAYKDRVGDRPRETRVLQGIPRSQPFE